MRRVKAFMDSDSLAIISKFFIWFTIIYSIIIGSAFCLVVKEWKIYAKEAISIMESNGRTSVSDICAVMKCRYTKDGKEKKYIDGEETFINNYFTNSSFGELIDFMAVVPIHSEKTGITFGLSIADLISSYIKITATLYIFIMAISLIFLIKYLIRSNMRFLVDGAGKAAMLHNKNMAMLAEQLHHELNTPLSVVKELCDKIFKTIYNTPPCPLDDKKNPNCKICGVPKDFENIKVLKHIIDNNINQAFVFIDRMADAKQIKYSNGNKSLYDIAKATFDVMSIFNRTNYNFTIDSNLSKYRINHSTGLKNHELMNILVNHIKNSLEAGASHIVISINKIVPYRPSLTDKAIFKAIDFIGKHNFGFIGHIAISVLYKMISIQAKTNLSVVRLALIDNGSGIPKEFQDKIFDLNASSKEKNGVVRGVGLYLNRKILRESYGDLWLHKTSNKGTTFILDVPAEEKPSL